MSTSDTGITAIGCTQDRLAGPGSADQGRRYSLGVDQSGYLRRVIVGKLSPLPPRRFIAGRQVLPGFVQVKDVALGVSHGNQVACRFENLGKAHLRLLEALPLSNFSL